MESHLSDFSSTRMTQDSGAGLQLSPHRLAIVERGQGLSEKTVLVTALLVVAIWIWRLGVNTTAVPIGLRVLDLIVLGCLSRRKSSERKKCPGKEGMQGEEFPDQTCPNKARGW